MNRSLLIPTARVLKRLKKKKKKEGGEKGREEGKEKRVHCHSYKLKEKTCQKQRDRKRQEKWDCPVAPYLRKWATPRAAWTGDCMRSGSPPFRATIQMICLYDFPFSAEIYNLFVFFLLVSSYTMCHITSGSLKTPCHLLHWMTNCSLRGSFRVSQSEFCEYHTAYILIQKS